ncbi:hypothetical protein EHF33_17345 (plasmid) [Deinococcus psychrotolerans]|uniref:Transporter n=1 Tax=Deinococcus psychrotolerans TaxID=2489213 RepID=A0A3G8YI54_9DEIO|nr:TolC family protein [Deinococcus psychrotolerans]AZI44663.1 hypothetical protein EHF33_17345 [Deinococcus psychrotolerans]
MKWLIVSAALLGPAQAQTETAAPPVPPTAPTVPTSAPAITPLSQFFAPLQQYPSLVQARLALQAAQIQQNGADFPVSGSVSGGLSDILNADSLPAVCATSPLALLTSPCAPVGGNTGTLNLAIRATPYPVGDTAARQQQAALATEQAQLGYRSAVAALEAQALLAAQRETLSRSTVSLAQQVQATAQLALQAAQNRLQGGGATLTDVQQAQLVLAQAASGAAQAQENLALAQATLKDLTGNADAPNLPAVLPPTNGLPVSVRHAQFGLRRAQITQAQVSWNALPNVQASYTHYTSDTAGVGLSLDSRNLSPAVTFTYSPRPPPLNRVRDQVSLGINFDASASILSAPELAQNAVNQAQAGIDAARRQADLQLSALNAALTQAQRGQQLAQQALSLAQQQQQNALTRQDLGLSAPLDIAQAALTTYQAQLALNQAELVVTDATTKFYSFFALPLDSADQKAASTQP